MGVVSDAPPEGEAELDVLLPRELFGNNLKGLSVQLKSLDFALQAFAQVATGSSEPVELREISATTPLFGIHISPEALSEFLKGVKIALDVVNNILSARRAVMELKSKLPQIDQKPAEDAIAAQQRAQIDEAVKQQMLDYETRRGEERTRDLDETLRRAYLVIIDQMEHGAQFVVRSQLKSQGDGGVNQEALIEAININNRLAFPTAPAPGAARLTDGREARDGSPESEPPE